MVIPHPVPRVSCAQSCSLSWIPLCLILVILADISDATGQTSASWAQSLNSTTYNSGSDVAVSESGDVYFAGTFKEGLPMDGGLDEALSSAGASDVWLTRMGPAGETIWMRSFGGTGDDRANRILPDEKGNIYITGTFEATLDLGTHQLESRGEGDAFLAKFDASGSLLWIEQAGGTGPDRGVSLALDADGAIYWSGAFEQTAYFGRDGSTHEQSAGRGDAFIARYTSDGDLDWVETAGGLNRDIATGLAVGPKGHVYMIGVTGGFRTIPQDKIRGIYSGFDDLFVARYSSEGALDWMMYSGGRGFDAANSIAVDQEGYVYVTGYFETYAWFASTNNEEHAFSGASFDLFLARYDSEGMLQWVRTGGGDGWDNAYDVSLDAAGNPYLTGLFRQDLIIDNDQKVQISGEGESNAFIARFDADGSIQGLQSIAGTKSEAFALDVDANGALYLTGFFVEEARFGDIRPSLTSASTNTFMAKYPSLTFDNPPELATQSPSEQPDKAVVSVSNYPNPFAASTLITFYLRESSSVKAIIYDALGRIVQNISYPSLPVGTHNLPVDMAQFPAGTYFFTIQTPDFTSHHSMSKH